MLAKLKNSSEKLIHAAKLAAVLGVALVAAGYSSSMYAADTASADSRGVLHKAPNQA